MARHVLDLASMLDALGRLQVVVCPGSGWLPETLIARGLPCFVAGINPTALGLIKGNSTLYALTRRQRGEQPLIVHLHGRFPILCSIITSLTPNSPRLMATVHQFSVVNRGGWLKWRERLETLMLRRCASVICVSQALRDEVAQRIGAGRTPTVRFVPNWIVANGAPPSRSESRKSDAPFRVIGIGRLSHEKGFDILLQGMAVLRRRGDNVTCDIVGDGPQRHAMLRAVAAFGLEGVVSIPGPASDARSFVEQYDAVVIPSRSESFGLVALEAYAAGVPVIASDVPGLNEVVEDGKTGVLFRSEDPSALVDAIAKVASDPTLRNALIRNARVAVSERYCETAVQPLLLAEYDRVSSEVF